MAKIPRIDLGDRPSGIPSPIALDTSTSDMLGSATSTSAAAMGVATSFAQKEQRRLAEAMEAKQRIVDASDVGQLTTRFESNVYKIEDDLHKEFAQNPAAAIDEYLKRAREALPQNVEAAPNDRVKLGATQGNEATISSGVARMHSWVSSRQTERVKGNLVLKEFAVINAARDYTNTAQLQNAFARVDADPEFDLVYGPNAGAKRDVLKSQMAKAQLETQSERAPRSTLGLLKTGSGFYGQYLDPNDFSPLKEKAKRDALKIEDNKMFETLTSFGERGNKLLKFADAGMADAAVIFTERTELEGRRRSIIDNTELSPEAKEKQFAEIEKHKKFIDAVELWQSRNTRTQYFGDDDTPAEIWVQRDKVFANENPPLADILTYRQMVLDAGVDKRMSPGRVTTLLQEIGLATPAAVSGATDNTGWPIFRDDIQAGTKALKREIEINTDDTPLSAKAEGKVYSKFVELYTQEQKRTGTLPKREAMIRLAKRAYYIATDEPMPKDLK